MDWLKTPGLISNLGRVTPINKAPAPNRRPSFPLGGPGEFEYRICALSASPAAVGEAQRWTMT